jgi:hypothetical protein
MQNIFAGAASLFLPVLLNLKARSYERNRPEGGIVRLKLSETQNIERLESETIYAPRCVPRRAPVRTLTHAPRTPVRTLPHSRRAPARTLLRLRAMKSINNDIDPLSGICGFCVEGNRCFC